MRGAPRPEGLSYAVAGLAALGLFAVVGVSDPTAGEEPALAEEAPGPCPAGSREEPDRARRLRELLASAGSGRELAAGPAKSVRICFGRDVEGGVRPDRAVVLDGAVPERESAARLGHLLLHLVDGLPLADAADPSRPCSEVVAEALDAEARAHARELTVRRELGVEQPRVRYPFEEAFWAAPAAERVDVIADHFREHPEGGDGAPGLATAYARRCEAARRER